MAWWSAQLARAEGRETGEQQAEGQQGMTASGPMDGLGREPGTQLHQHHTLAPPAATAAATAAASSSVGIIEMPSHLVQVPEAQKLAVLAAIRNETDYDNFKKKRQHQWTLVGGAKAWSCACDWCKENNLVCLVGVGKVCVNCWLGSKKCGAGGHWRDGTTEEYDKFGKEHERLRNLEGTDWHPPKKEWKEVDKAFAAAHPRCYRFQSDKDRWQEQHPDEVMTLDGPVPRDAAPAAAAAITTLVRSSSAVNAPRSAAPAATSRSFFAGSPNFPPRPPSPTLPRPACPDDGYIRVAREHVGWQRQYLGYYEGDLALAEQARREEQERMHLAEERSGRIGERKIWTRECLGAAAVRWVEAQSKLAIELLHRVSAGVLRPLRRQRNPGYAAPGNTPVIPCYHCATSKASKTKKKLTCVAGEPGERCNNCSGKDGSRCNVDGRVPGYEDPLHTIAYIGSFRKSFKHSSSPQPINPDIRRLCRAAGVDKVEDLVAVLKRQGWVGQNDTTPQQALRHRGFTTNLPKGRHRDMPELLLTKRGAVVYDDDDEEDEDDQDDAALPASAPVASSSRRTLTAPASSFPVPSHHHGHQRRVASQGGWQGNGAGGASGRQGGVDEVMEDGEEDDDEEDEAGGGEGHSTWQIGRAGMSASSLAQAPPSSRQQPQLQLQQQQRQQQHHHNHHNPHHPHHNQPQHHQHHHQGPRRTRGPAPDVAAFRAAAQRLASPGVPMSSASALQLLEDMRTLHANLPTLRDSAEFVAGSLEHQGIPVPDEDQVWLEW